MQYRKITRDLGSYVIGTNKGSLFTFQTWEKVKTNRQRSDPKSSIIIPLYRTYIQGTKQDLYYRIVRSLFYDPLYIRQPIQRTPIYPVKPPGQKVTAAHIYDGPSIPNRKNDPGPSTGQPRSKTRGPWINNFNDLPYRKTLTLQSVLTRKYLKLLCQVYPANSRVWADLPLASA